MPSDMIKTIKFEDHYKEMKRRFDVSCNWVWIIHSMAVVGCFIAFLIIPGKELVYSLYIPLDVLLGFGKASFFWYNYWVDKKRKEDKRRLKEKLAQMERKKQQLEEQLVATGKDTTGKLDASFQSNHSDESSQHKTGVIRRATTKQLRLQKEQDLH